MKTTNLTKLLLLLATLVILGCEVDPEAVANANNRKKVEHGKYLVAVTGCHDCHTPLVMAENGPEPDMTRALSGHPASFPIAQGPAFESPEWVWAGSPTNTAFAGPWGVSFAANLTPDKATGIGIWTEEQFIQTIRSGKHWGVDRPILPPMPWPAYANMTDEDLGAIYAYLQTIPAQDNPVPQPIPPQVATR